jgi:putative ABC transport system substrate-binding protein
MKRREFVTLLSGAAVWPLAARAQQGERMRRIGVLMGFDENDPDVTKWLSGLMRELAGLGWTIGRRLRIDTRWAAANMDRMQAAAKELVGLQPDVLLSASTPATAALAHETKTIPIVFVLVADPIGSGFVTMLPRPGGNITGFGWMEGSVASVWLELLAQIAPRIRRAAMMFNPDTAPYVKSYFQPSFEAGARSLDIEPIAAPVRSDAEIETVMISLGREPPSGLVAMPDVFMEDIEYQSCMASVHSPPSKQAVCFPTDQTTQIYFAAPPTMSIASSEVRSQPICPFNFRQNFI